MKNIHRKTRTLGGGLIVIALVAMAQAGCQQKREILDVETPSGQVKVNQDKDTGDVTVDVDRKPASE